MVRSFAFILRDCMKSTQEPPSPQYWGNQRLRNRLFLLPQNWGRGAKAFLHSLLAVTLTESIYLWH